MDGQRDQENFLKWMSLNFGGSSSDISYGPEDIPNQDFVMAAGRTANYPNALPLPQWTNCQKAPCNYVEFLEENSTFLENASGADMLETITSPICGEQSVYGVSEIQREFLFSNLGKARDYRPADPSLNMDALKIRYQNPHNGVESANRFTSFQQQILSQNFTSWTQEAYKDNCNMSQPRPRVTVAPSFFKSKTHSSVSRLKAASTDRDRRIRISERLRALQELLPHSVEGSQAAIMDDIIDHIKFLQLQLKELSRNRLGDPSTSGPFIFLEGYGHYVVNEQMTNEPLEEMMGKLLEMNPSAASQLLESRGLYMMPMSLVEELLQAS